MEDSIEDYIRISQIAKKPTDSQQNIRAKALITLQKQRECQSRALSIVQLMIEGALQPQIFLQCLPELNQTYYQDVVEERAITNLCGYALCGLKIQELRKGTYYINNKINKVYDITDRKNYCSNYCYQASTFAKEQISNTPLWLRNQEKLPAFTLLPSTTRCSPGKEVLSPIERAEPAKDDKFTSVFAFASASLSEVGGDMKKTSPKAKHSDNKNLQKSNLPTINENEVSNETHSAPLNHPTAPISMDSKTSNLPTISEDENISSDNNIQEVEINGDGSDEVEPPKKTISKTTKGRERKRSKRDVKNVLEEVEKSFKEWITLETYIFLYGEDTVRQTVETLKLDKCLQSLEISKSASNQRLKYLEVCKRLQLSEYEDKQFDSDAIEDRLKKPVPDYGALKEESKSLELKIKSFYSGSDCTLNKGNTGHSQEKHLEDREEAVPILPLVDSKLQRLKIFLNSLSKIMNNLLDLLDIASDDVMPNLKSLVKTFKLDANNVVFHTKVWNLIAIILLKMLIIPDDSLKNHLESEKYRLLVSVMLDQYPNGNVFVGSLMEKIRDINFYVEQYVYIGS